MTTFDVMFIAVLGAVYSAVLPWAFKTLPRERWQVLATLPTHKDADGRWQGVNLTVYGFITACAYGASLILLLVLLGAVHAPLAPTFALLLALLAAVVPASSVLARIIEKKHHTFTVGGAAFVGIVLAPPVILAIDAVAGRPVLPLMPTLAALAIAYALGEGTGRLACISFGCCYGKPLDACPAPVQRLFRDRHFVFEGETKKIAYAAGLAGHKVVPIQAVTCVVYVATALAATAVFLAGAHRSALLLALGVVQLWRVASETLRADERGGGRFSTYQRLAFAGLVYAGLVAVLAPAAPIGHADVRQGLAVLWQPGVIVFLQLVWLGIFVYVGRSMVTGARVDMFVCRDRI